LKVNRSVKDIRSEEWLTLSRLRRRGPTPLKVLPAMALYVLFGYVLVQRAGNFLLGTLAVAVAYGIAVYLYYGLATLTYRNHGRLVWLSAAATAVLGLFLAGFNQTWTFVNTWLMIVLAGFVTGRMMTAGLGNLKIYLTGLGIIFFFSLVLYVPHWPEMMKAMTTAAHESVANFKSYMITAGYSQSLADDYAVKLEKMLDMLTRLIPASMIMGTVVQYSIGFLLFFLRVVERGMLKNDLPDFLRWKMPFAFMPVVILTILVRLLGGGTLQLVADNVMLMLAIYYCLTGLSLSEYFIKKLQVSLTVRIVFYILLVFSNLYGFFMMALLGFIDSFKDWRKVTTAESG
jgi:hypothetical protein